MLESTITFSCQSLICDNDLSAKIFMPAQGLHDEGYWIIQCDRCRKVFSFSISADIHESRLLAGGRILRRCDNVIYTKNEVERLVKELDSQRESKMEIAPDGKDAPDTPTSVSR